MHKCLDKDRSSLQKGSEVFKYLGVGFRNDDNEVEGVEALLIGTKDNTRGRSDKFSETLD
jgi:hypothetical protein